jgi:hypothetical protein
VDAEAPRGRVPPGGEEVAPVLGDEPDPEYERDAAVVPVAHREGEACCEGREPEMPLMDADAEDVPARAERVALETDSPTTWA